MNTTKLGAFMESGLFQIDADFSTSVSAFISTHEEMHGILRRSTLFGRILKKASSLTSKESALLLTTKSRTSDEVLATFVPANLARWNGMTDLIRTLFERFPSYRFYDAKALQVVKHITDNPLLQSSIIEGFIRFCWCSRLLIPLIESEEVDHRQLAELPDCAWPDKRFDLALKRLGDNGLVSIVHEMLNFPAARLWAGKTFDEVYNPDIGGLRLMQVPGIEANVAVAKLHAAIGAALEGAVVYAMNLFTRKFLGTDLDACEQEEVYELLKTQGDESHKNKNELNSTHDPLLHYPLIEQIVNRAERLKVFQTDMPKVYAGEMRPIIGLRSPYSFRNNFDLSEHVNVTDCSIGENLCALYDLTLEPFYNHLSNKPFPIHWEIVDALSLRSTLKRRPQTGKLVVAWATQLLQYPSEILAIGSEWRLWVVCDCDPLLLLTKIRPWIGQVRSFFRSPIKDKPNVGAVVVTELKEGGGSSSLVQGVIFPIYRHHIRLIIRHLDAVFDDDDFRGFGESPLFTDEDQDRQKYGEIITKWLLATEQIFAIQ